MDIVFYPTPKDDSSVMRAIRFGFRGKTQFALFSIIREYIDTTTGQTTWAEVLFEIWPKWLKKKDGF